MNSVKVWIILIPELGSIERIFIKSTTLGMLFYRRLYICSPGGQKVLSWNVNIAY